MIDLRDPRGAFLAAFLREQVDFLPQSASEIIYSLLSKLFTLFASTTCFSGIMTSYLTFRTPGGVFYQFFTQAG